MGGVDPSRDWIMTYLRSGPVWPNLGQLGRCAETHDLDVSGSAARSLEIVVKLVGQGQGLGVGGTVKGLQLASRGPKVYLQGCRATGLQ